MVRDLTKKPTRRNSTKLLNAGTEKEPNVVVPDDDRAKELIRNFKALKNARQNWESNWNEISDYVVPDKAHIQTDKANRQKGDERHDFIYDGSPEHYNELLASALHSMLTNPAGQWFSLTTNNETIDSDPSVKKYLQELVRVIHDYLNNSNFQTEVHEFYIDLGSFGTGALLVQKDDDDTFKFLSVPIYELYVQENYKGVVDTVFREDTMTVIQAFQRFGKEAFGDKAEEMLKKPNDPVKTVHAVIPRNDAIYGKVNKLNKPFASINIWIDHPTILKESGFDQNPYIISRWIKTSGETYGRSPGMKAMPDIRMLNSMMKTTVRAAQKIVDPPLMIPDDGIMGRVNTTPGGLNSYRAGTQDRIFPLETRGDIGIGLEMMRDTRERIKAAFFIDQLQLKEGPQMTATEVNQRVEEQLRLLGPILGRQHYEFLKPLIARLISILESSGKLPENPPAILGAKEGQLNVFFSSQIAKAQRVADATNILRFIETSAPAIQLQPNSSDILDSEEILRLNAQLYGIDQRIFRDPKDVKAIREDRINEQEAAAEQEANKTNSETLNNLQQAQGGQ